MEHSEIIKRAIDSTSGFFSTQTEAVDVNPSPVWDTSLRAFIRQNLVLAPYCQAFDFTQPGATERVTIDDEPAAAGALVETDDVAVTAFTSRYVTFTPLEYGAGYQLSDAEAVRAFFDVASVMVSKLGYAMFKKKDNLIYSTMLAGTGAGVNANGVVTSDMASTDTLNLTDIITQRQAMVAAKYAPKVLLVSPTQEGQLMKITTLQQANTFGNRNVLGEGFVGSLFGMDVVMSHSVTEAANKSTALILGVSGSGEKATGIATKRPAKIEKQYFARGRYWDIVGTEEYGITVLHPSAIRAIRTYI
jgi:hypothetical protein